MEEDKAIDHAWIDLFQSDSSQDYSRILNYIDKYGEEKVLSVWDRVRELCLTEHRKDCSQAMKKRWIYKMLQNVSKEIGYRNLSSKSMVVSFDSVQEEEQKSQTSSTEEDSLHKIPKSITNSSIIGRRGTIHEESRIVYDLLFETYVTFPDFSGSAYGEFTLHTMCCKIFQFFVNRDIPVRGFLDIGSGRGLPNTLAATYFPHSLQTNMGIECDRRRWLCSLTNADSLHQVPSRSLQNNLSILPWFLCLFAEQLTSLNPFDLIYMYDWAFYLSNEALMRHLGHLFNTSRSTRFLVCCTPPTTLTEKYGFEATLIHKISGITKGANEKKTLYFYEKTLPPDSTTIEWTDPIIEREKLFLGQLNQEMRREYITAIKSISTEKRGVTRFRSYGSDGNSLKSNEEERRWFEEMLNEAKKQVTEGSMINERDSSDGCKDIRDGIILEEDELYWTEVVTPSRQTSNLKREEIGSQPTTSQPLAWNNPIIVRDENEGNQSPYNEGRINDSYHNDKNTRESTSSTASSARLTPRKRRKSCVGQRKRRKAEELIVPVRSVSNEEVDGWASSSDAAIFLTPNLIESLLSKDVSLYTHSDKVLLTELFRMVEVHESPSKPSLASDLAESPTLKTLSQFSDHKDSFFYYCY